MKEPKNQRIPLVESISTKRHMKSNNDSQPGETAQTITSCAQAKPARGWKRRVALAPALLMVACATSVTALTITPLGKGTLPTGDIILTIQVRLEPGDVVPWHYHVGSGWATILSGTLTEDEGCGSALNQYSAGQAFAEIPGKIHTAYNAGTEPVLLLWTEIYGPCYDNSIGWIFVDGPICEGTSGRSHLEKIPNCP